MATTIEIPDFDFSAFYYPELLEALIAFKRQNVPELTDESAFEPFIQLIRAQALVGHLNNVLVDLVANESTLPTAKLAETVRNMLRLIDFELDPATPAQVDLIYQLSRVFAASAVVVPAAAQAATKKQGDEPVRYYEALTALTIQRTDELGFVWSKEAGVFTDHTTEANSPTTPADDFTPWATPAVGDAIFFGHPQVMWDKLSIGPLTTPASGIVGVWEYYDGNFKKTAPTSVSVVGPNLEVDLTSYLGTSNRAGTPIRVQLNETTVYEDAVSVWNGSINKVTVGLLGQSSPSVDPTDYTVGSDWEILTEAVDNSVDLTTGGEKVEFPLPQTLARNWIQGQASTDAGFTDEAFWLRYRIVEVATPTGPVMQFVRMDEGKQYVQRLATQGQSVEDSPLGSSTGLPNQEFQTTRDYFISGSESVYVDGELWARVDNFLASTPTSEHYTVELGKNDRLTIKFGDGTTGKLPPLGVNNVRVEYRVGANNNGNVGSNTITVDKTGLSFASKLWNPRQANGWQEADGSSEESLEQVKIEGPATLRTKEVALTPEDAVTLTLAFTDENGAKPFTRARAFEESFGPKTVELTVVAAGGGQATAEQLAALELYFNGDQYAYPPVPKVFVANQEIVAINFTPKLIDVTATVYGDVTAQEVINRLEAVIQPEALKDDGVTYEWTFGGEVDDSRIMKEIFKTDESITRVELTTPTGLTSLLPRELPQLGAVSITIIEP